MQPLGKTWIDEMGYLMTTCEFCEHEDAPYQIDAKGFEVDDVTEEEITEYLRKTNE